MYRSTVVFCFVFFSALTHYLTCAMSDDQKAKIHARFEEMGAECMTDFPITEDDIKVFRAREMPTGANTACFAACMLKKSGVMDEKGILNGETALSRASQVFEDPEEIKNIGDYLHSCKSVNDAAVGDGEKGCERAVLAFKCMKDNASKFGLAL